MMKSESIAKLADALSKAQGEMVSAKKEADNPFFKSKYSDLSSVYDACRAPLAKHGLSIVQTPTFDETGRVGMQSLIMHSSGEWIESPVMLMRPVKDDPQGFGSVITYLRRYCLSALVGISSESDDDANAASGKDAKVTSEPRTFGTPKAKQPELAKFNEEHPPVAQPEANGFIDRGRVVNFNKSFRESLPKDFQKDAEKLRHEWLGLEGFLREGNPTAEVITMASFEDVKRRACEFASRYDGKVPF